MKKRVYFGETSRTLYHRANQHLSDHSRAARKEGRGAPNTEDDPGLSSWIVDHAKETHGGINGLDPQKDVRFIKENTHRDPLSRQVEEASLIT